MCRKPGKVPGIRAKSRLAQAYARHLCMTRADCRSVSIHVQHHLIPEMEEVHNASRFAARRGYDLFAESLFTTPEWIGDYPCARLLAEAMAYLRHVSRAAHAGWNVFFFSPADPTTLGLMRIAVGLLAFWSLLVFGLDLHDYFGSTGWAAAAIQSGQRRLIWSFWFLVPDGWLRLSGASAWRSWRSTRWDCSAASRRSWLGDRGLDCSARADRALWLRPGHFDAARFTWL